MRSTEVTPLFTQDRDNYFVTGLPNPLDETADRPRIRFQFSFKYNLLPNQTGFGLFFAFTQKSMAATSEARLPTRMYPLAGTGSLLLPQAEREMTATAASTWTQRSSPRS